MSIESVIFWETCRAWGKKTKNAGYSVEQLLIYTSNVHICAFVFKTVSEVPVANVLFSRGLK